MTTTFSISPFTGARREERAVTQIVAAVFDEEQVSNYEARAADEFRAADSGFDASQYLFRRYLAVEDDTDEIVGYAQFYHTPWAFDPQRFHMTIRVHPDYQNVGIGARLYEQIMADLTGLGARVVRAEVHETMEVGCGFLERRGWHELFRSWQYTLNPQRFDPAPFKHSLDQLAAENITFTTVAEESQHGTGWLPRLHELHTTLRADVPGTVGYTPLPLERFALMVGGNPESLPDAFGIARDGEHYVGESFLQRGKEPDSLEQKFTGVLRAYRGRGIATALTLKTIAYAAEYGYGRVTTWTESSNAAMVAICEKLGFERERGTVWYEKELTI